MSAVRMYQRGVYLVTAALCAFAPFASAQDANVVLLESFDKSIAVSGELIEATNGQYKVSTVAGVISIDVNSVSCSGDACPAVVPNFSSGAQVRLTSNDGAVDISGNITDIIDGQYVVDNAVLGTLSIGTEVVNCAGPGCPQGLRFADETTIATEAPVVDAPASNEETAPVTVPVAESDTQETPTEPADNAQTDTPVADATTQDESLNASFSFAGSDTVGFGLLPLLLKDYAEAINATADTRTISETQSLVRYIDSDANEISSAYVDATGSGDATDALEIKAAVFGMTSRQIRDEEASRLIASGSSDLRNTDNETVIAVDSLAVITHPSNPVSRLSIAELAAIYLGQIDNWSQVGGLDAPITVLSREDGSSTRGVFENVIFDGEEQALAQRVTYPGGDNPEMAAAVKEDPLAIGYVGFAFSEGLNRLDLTSECGITSTATSFAVKTEEYPLGRRLYLYNRTDNMPEEANRFLQYVLSPEADDAIAQSSFVNFAVERIPLSPSRYDGLYEGLRVPAVAQLANQLKDDLDLWDRFSTTIRFRFGSFRLEKKELNDIDRLVSKLGELPQETQIAAVGFTDEIGPFDANLRLSRLRAQAVADAIQTTARENGLDIQVDTRSYSELSPSVCNTGAIGRAINRRVEIWVRK